MKPLLKPSGSGERCELHCPRAMPLASTFLWNRHLLLQVNCRGYVVARHMQPEPAGYSRAPVLEQRTFMLPEQGHYAHHPGRFVYIRDHADEVLYSVPYEPVRRQADRFVFSAGPGDVEWRVARAGVAVRWSVSVPPDDVVELWTLAIRNDTRTVKRLNVFPYFSIGYMSWMNQAARYRRELGGVVATSITPYQELEDYERIAAFKDCTFLLHDTEPQAWETSQREFEGEGGLHDPDAIRTGRLGNGDADYEIPTAALQYRLRLAPGEWRSLKFLFGPARDDEEIAALRRKYLAAHGFQRSRHAYREFLSRGNGCLDIRTPDDALDCFVNHWLARQVYYHGDANRLCTDPQTRNYLQDAMGMVYVRPDAARGAIRRALAQQRCDGSMPDGILLHEAAKLKYINRIPHTDHCIWIPVCLEAYLDETGDYELLDASPGGLDDASRPSVFDCLLKAMRWLLGNLDRRGLSLIAQGDWCDPMNMVGHRGRGVSGWLSVATVHALRIVSALATRCGRPEVAAEMDRAAERLTGAIQAHLWDGDWFARGITDDGRAFGVRSDDEGRIYLNPQSWALLAGVASPAQAAKIVAAVDEHLSTPYGMALLAPPYTRMREDIGRLTQKYPGSAENGSVYNHAAAFYVYALYRLGDSDRAFAALRRMVPGPDDEDYRRRGQLPVFVPNYYRGAARELPRTAGRSSQLCNTGAASWLYRILVEWLFGLRGARDGLEIAPNLPSAWPAASVVRRFRGATVTVSYRRDGDPGSAPRIRVDGVPIDDAVVRGIVPGRRYEIEVVLPPAPP